MQENDKPVLIYSTFPDFETAKNAGEVLTSQALCACVNIMPGMTSIYRWQGAIETAREVVMFIKTRAGLKEAVFEAVKSITHIKHPHSWC